MVQVDPIEVPSAAAYEKYAAARPCVLSTEQSRGFKCGICLGELAQPGRRFPATPHAATARCAELLSEPVSTPCGHNFCAECLRHAMICAPRCPLCREQLQGPFRVNHVLADMIALLQVQSPKRPSPVKGFAKSWYEPPGSVRDTGSARGRRDDRQLSQLPALGSPRHPLQ